MKTEEKVEKWPKVLPLLSSEQLKIKDDFMKLWHEVLPNKYGIVEKFNHGYPVNVLKKNNSKIKTLEIGAGLGEHISYEDLSFQDYHALELRPEMASVIKEKYKNVNVEVGDCQKKLTFNDNSFDRVLAIHVLEHLPHLPAALSEIYRVLKNTGQFTVVLPCEGGIAYKLAREISAKRVFEKKYNQSYDWYIKSEHINLPREIIEELERLFIIKERGFFPLKLPSFQFNLCFGLDLIKK